MSDNDDESYASSHNSDDDEQKGSDFDFSEDDEVVTSDEGEEGEENELDDVAEEEEQHDNSGGEDDEDEDEENYLEKFEKDVNKNYVNDFHPECISHNFEEVAALCVVTRDEDNIINDELHKTIPFLTKYERARVLGQRAKQIEYGDQPLVEVDMTLIESHIIAEMELLARKIPFIIKRPIPGGGFEYWKLIDLELIAY